MLGWTDGRVDREIAAHTGKGSHNCRCNEEPSRLKRTLLLALGTIAGKWQRPQFGVLPCMTERVPRREFEEIERTNGGNPLNRRYHSPPVDLKVGRVTHGHHMPLERSIPSANSHPSHSPNGTAGTRWR